MAGHAGGTGEDDVIKGQFGERLAHFRPAGDHRDFALVKRRFQHFLHQRRSDRRIFRWLDHRPVAGSQHTRQRREGEVHREIPRGQDTNDALGLPFHPRFRTKQAHGEIQLALFRLHPGIEMLQRMLERLDRRHNVGDQAEFGRTVAEILAHRSGKAVLVGQHHIERAVQPVATGGGRHRQFGGEAGALRIKHAPHVRGIAGIPFSGFGDRGHGSSPLFVWAQPRRVIRCRQAAQIEGELRRSDRLAGRCALRHRGRNKNALGK